MVIFYSSHVYRVNYKQQNRIYTPKESKASQFQYQKKVFLGHPKKDPGIDLWLAQRPENDVVGIFTHL
jgi:hypothetical protein